MLMALHLTQNKLFGDWMTSSFITGGRSILGFNFGSHHSGKIILFGQVDSLITFTVTFGLIIWPLTTIPPCFLLSMLFSFFLAVVAVWLPLEYLVAVKK